MLKDGWGDIECNICNSKGYKILYKSNYDTELVERQFSQYSVYCDIVKCNKCGLIYESPREKIDIINRRLVTELYPIKVVAIQERSRFFEIYIKNIKKNIPLSGKLLDIGCNIGDFMYLMQKERLEVYGIEPSFYAAQRAEKIFGLKIINDVVDDAINNFSDEFFDIVTMWDVIEHLSDPRNTLYKINKKLKKGGYLCITTHNINSLFAKISRAGYPHLMYQHFYHFSDKTLKTILNMAGFEISKIEIFNKRWSIGYLIMLLKEFFPKNKFARRISDILSNTATFLHLQNVILLMPLYNDLRVYAKKK